MTPDQAEKLQNDIYRKMAPEKKLKILGEFFMLGRKLNSLKYGHRAARRAFASNRKNSK